MTFKRPVKGRPVRAGFPIHAYVGPNGSGKSTAACWDTIPELLAGRQVLSTVRILDFQNPRPCDDDQCATSHLERGVPHDHMAAHPLWVPFTRWHQLIEFRGGGVLMDEVTGVASSRDSHAMPSPVLNHLMQLRRCDVTLRWTAPSWARADIGIRSVTQAVTSCRGLVKKAVPPVEGELPRVWSHRRLFVWRTYDAFQFDDFTTAMTQARGGQKPRLRSIKTDWHWGPGSPAFHVFDTFDSVLAIGATNAATGRCMTCDGRRSAPSCSCDDYDPPTRSRRTGSLPGSGGAPRSGVAASGSATGAGTERPVVSLPDLVASIPATRS